MQGFSSISATASKGARSRPLDFTPGGLRHPELVEASSRNALTGDLIGMNPIVRQERPGSLMRIGRTHSEGRPGDPTAVRGSCTAAGVVKESRVEQVLAEG